MVLKVSMTAWAILALALVAGMLKAIMIATVTVRVLVMVAAVVMVMERDDGNDD